MKQNLELTRCPHCNVNTPNIILNNNFVTANSAGYFKREWGIYICQKCGGVVTASSLIDPPRVAGHVPFIFHIYPEPVAIDKNIPERARTYLEQAIESVHTPSGAIMLTASAVDAMLKNKGYKRGSLYSRIKKAADEHLLTAEMEKWAHQVRLEANDERHADEEVEDFPNEEEALRVINFAIALAEFLFVLPAKVEEGIQESRKVKTKETPQKMDMNRSVGSKQID